MKKMILNFLSVLLLLSVISCRTENNSPGKNNNYCTFSFTDSLTLPGNPEEIYDAITGDISGWWDHSFSENPYKFYIEAKPGGRFYELFNESGDGVLHATVIYAERGKILRMDGPLGLSGTAIQIVTTYNFSSVGNDSTGFKYEVHASGEMSKGTDEIVKAVWKHFIFDRFKPYIEGLQK